MKPTPQLPILICVKPPEDQQPNGNMALESTEELLNSFMLYRCDELTDLQRLTDAMLSSTDEGTQIREHYELVTLTPDSLNPITNTLGVSCELKHTDNKIEVALQELRIKCQKSPNLADVVRRLVEEIGNILEGGDMEPQKQQVLLKNTKRVLKKIARGYDFYKKRTLFTLT